jgi:hypothetical protein
MNNLNQHQPKLQKITSALTRARTTNKQTWIVVKISQIWDKEALAICRAS